VSDRGEDAWMIGHAETVTAPCGCVARAEPVEVVRSGPRDGPCWMLVLEPCEQHEDVDASEIGGDLIPAMLEQEPRTSNAALLATCLDRIQSS
jgi:hypothetical protein